MPTSQALGPDQALFRLLYPASQDAQCQFQVTHLCPETALSAGGTPPLSSGCPCAQLGQACGTLSQAKSQEVASYVQAELGEGGEHGEAARFMLLLGSSCPTEARTVPMVCIVGSAGALTGSDSETPPLHTAEHLGGSLIQKGAISG